MITNSKKGIYEWTCTILITDSIWLTNNLLDNVKTAHIFEKCVWEQRGVKFAGFLYFTVVICENCTKKTNRSIRKKVFSLLQSKSTTENYNKTCAIIHKKFKVHTPWKVFVFEVFLVCIQSECSKIGTRKTPNTDTVHAVPITQIEHKIFEVR